MNPNRSRTNGRFKKEEKSDIERFEERYIKAENGCWEWQHARAGGRYGAFRIGGRQLGAHRVSLFLYKNLPVSGKALYADHLCKNKICVNPDHLEMVTPRENSIRK